MDMAGIKHASKGTVEAIRLALYANPRATLGEVAAILCVSAEAVQEVQRGEYEDKFGSNPYQTYSSKQAAEMIGCSTSTVYRRAVKLGILENDRTHVGRTPRYTIEEIEKIRKELAGVKIGLSNKISKRQVEEVRSEIAKNPRAATSEIAAKCGVGVQVVRKVINGGYDYKYGKAEYRLYKSNEAADILGVSCDQVRAIGKNLGLWNELGKGKHVLMNEYELEAIRKAIQMEKPSKKRERKQKTSKDAQIAYLEGKLKATQEALELAQANASKPGFFARLFSKKA